MQIYIDGITSMNNIYNEIYHTFKGLHTYMQGNSHIDYVYIRIIRKLPITTEEKSEHKST